MLGDSIRRRRGRGPEAAEAPEAGERLPAREGVGRVRLALAAVGVGGVLFAAGYLFATRVLYPPIDFGGASIHVPDVTGISYLQARSVVEAAGLSAGERTDLPHPDVAAGTVLAQAPLPGQGLRPGGAVRFAVSSGPPRLRVPDLVGFPVGTARDVLERAGVQVSVEERTDPASAGRVLAMDPGPGSERPLPSRVTLVISTGPAPADTLGPPDSLRVPIPPPVIPPTR